MSNDFPRRPAAELPLALLAWPALAWLVMAAVAMAKAGEPDFVLDLPDGGRVPGSFVSSPASDGPLPTLSWRSPRFETPLEFHLDELIGVRATGRGAPRADDPLQFSCRLRGGDIIDGQLEGIDERRVTITLPGGDPLAIDRELVTSIVRRKPGGAAGYVGPGGLAGWTQSPASAWRDEAGRITGDVPNSVVGRDVAAPARARFDIVLSWRRRPELSLAVAAGDGTTADPYRFEMLSVGPAGPAAMIVRQDVAAGMLEPVAVPDAAPGRLQLTLFVDQAAGRMAAAIAGGGDVVELSVPPRQDRDTLTGFRLRLISGDVCLERLRVSPWSSDEPVVGDPELTLVTFRGATPVVGTVQGLDEGGELLVKTAGGESRRRLADLEEIVFAAGDGPEPTPEAAAVRVVRRSGGVLTGDIVAVGERDLAIARAGIEPPVRVPLADLQTLVSLRAAEGRPLPGRQGTLRTGDAETPGCLVDAIAWGGGIAWQPRGSLAGSRLAEGPQGGIAATVDYVPRSEAAADQPGGQVEVGGMGGGVSLDDEGFFVVTMLAEEGAAARDGRITPGDRILAIRPSKDAPFVETKGLDQTTVMNLLRGRVGTPLTLRIGAAGGGRPRRIDLVRGLIYVAERSVLDEALAAHTRVVAGQVAAAGEAAGFPAQLVLRSGDVVPAKIDRIDEGGVRVRSPATASGGDDPVTVPHRLVRAVELDPAAASRGIEKAQWERLLTLPRSQQADPPTHLLRLESGDYLRGSLESLDGDEVRFTVLGQTKQLPYGSVVRIIWLHADETEGLEAAPVDAGAAEATAAAENLPGAGLVVQGITAGGGRTTLVAERMEGPMIVGTSLALGPSQIDTRKVDRLLIGAAVAAGDEELPFAKWRLRLAPLPRALRESEE